MSSKTIVLTGCTKGLGAALVAEFTAAGHRVVGCGRSASAIAELKSKYPESKGHRFDVVDVSSDAAVKAWATNVLASHGAHDILINNAAIVNDGAPLWEVPASDFGALVDVNLKGVANVIRHFMPSMVSRKKGVVVNFSSYWGRSTSANVAPYCCSKWGIEGMTKALAQDLIRGHGGGQTMAAVALNPGIIHTDMLETCFGADGAAGYPSAEEWGKVAAPFILALKPSDNGKSHTVPGF